MLLDPVSDSPALLSALAIKILIEELSHAYHAYCLIVRERRYLRWPGIDNFLALAESISVSAGLVPRTQHPPVAAALRLKTQSKEWCPHQLRRFVSRCSSAAMAELLQYDTLASVGHIHNKCTETDCSANNIGGGEYKQAHSTLCTENQICTMYLAEDDEREHSDVGFESADIAKIVKNGRLPLVSLSISENGHIEAELVQAQAKDAYLVISHVWSGGLGNIGGNTLPYCQIERLWDLLRRIQNSHSWENREAAEHSAVWTRRAAQVIDSGMDGGSDGLFPERSRLYPTRRAEEFRDQEPCETFIWIDTLCVPAGKADIEWRNAAIYNMAAIYADAYAMLVLDSCLEGSPSSNLRFKEPVATVACSAWMSRSWTLQEAALGLHWYISRNDSGNDYFESQYFTTMMKEMYETVDRSNQLGHRKDFTLGLDLETLFSDIHDAATTIQISVWRTNWSVSPRLGQVLRFVRIWNSLAGRSTTKKEDQQIIITTLLGVSVREILTIEPSESDPHIRMKTLLKRQKILPMALLYSTGSRSEYINDRWMLSFPEVETLEIEYGIMSISGDDLIISPKAGDLFDPAFDQIVPLGVLLSPGKSKLLTFCLIIDESRLWIKLESGSLSNNLFHSTCLIINVIHRALNRKDFVASEYLGKGACLQVISKKRSTIISYYDCPIAVYMSRPRDSESYPEIQGTKTSAGMTFIIKSNITQWPSIDKYSMDLYSLFTIFIKSVIIATVISPWIYFSVHWKHSPKATVAFIVYFAIRLYLLHHELRIWNGNSRTEHQRWIQDKLRFHTSSRFNLMGILVSCWEVFGEWWNFFTLLDIWIYLIIVMYWLVITGWFSL
jgi:hypothetical protein